MNHLKLSIAVLALPSLAFASKVAIIDSGTDYRHAKLAPQYELNTAETTVDGVDSDNNGYIDDTFGWNFAEKNREVIDYSYLGKFSSDSRKFFEVQTRTLDGTATDADRAWIAEKRKDEAFIKELGTFGNFTHGTHVAGISARDHLDTKVFAVKIIPTEVKLPFFRSSSFLNDGNTFKDILFKQGLGLLAKQQGKGLIPAGQYAGVRQADVANGSFGSSYTAIKGVVEQLYNSVYKEGERDPAKVEAFTKYFLDAVTTEMTTFVTSAPNTLFVFAAGNDGTNNDLFPVTPANVKTENTITVAATLHDGALAVFSNFGAEKVEVAAPGVGILSTIPGDEMMVMSGTSQAAPAVTNIAAEVKNLNPKLKPSEIKAILMGTVDQKSWLAGKVKTGGVVNADRAYAAASASVTRSLSDSIAESFRSVPRKAEVQPLSPISQPSLADAMVLPLPGLFQTR